MRDAFFCDRSLTHLHVRAQGFEPRRSHHSSLELKPFHAEQHG